MTRRHRHWKHVPLGSRQAARPLTRSTVNATQVFVAGKVSRFGA